MVPRFGIWLLMMSVGQIYFPMNCLHLVNNMVQSQYCHSFVLLAYCKCTQDSLVCFLLLVLAQLKFLELLVQVQMIITFILFFSFSC